VHFTVLRSGSSGNCSLVEHGSTRVLVDAGGHTQKGLAELFARSSVDTATLSAVLVTHLHGDHINIATMRLVQQQGIPLWMHHKNLERLSDIFAARYRDGVAVQAFGTEAFTVGGLNIAAFGVSHDARGTTNGFRFSPADNPSAMLVYAADLGHVPDTVVEHLLNAHTLFLESNHDVELLWKNPLRPYHHKKRVTGARGHLSNEQCAEALLKVAALSTKPPERVILGHLSGDHNSPLRALETVGAALAKAGVVLQLAVAPRDASTVRYDIG
jgi:phosphoribosyl 1,2-cyclic phosphodiesterase